LDVSRDCGDKLDRIAHLLNQILAATRFLAILALLILLQTCSG